MFISKDEKDTLYSKQKRRELILQNGFVCRFCSKKYIYKEGISQPDFAKFDIHHLLPLVQGGKTVLDMAEVICNDSCHSDLHMFIDIFSMESDVDYLFLTSVYVWFFCPYATEDLKRKHHYSKYARNLMGVSRLFWFFVSKCSVDTNSIFYAYYKSKESELNSFIRKDNYKIKSGLVNKSFKRIRSNGYRYKSLFGKYKVFIEKLGSVTC